MQTAGQEIVNNLVDCDRISNKPTAVFGISASVHLVCSTTFEPDRQSLQHCLCPGCCRRSSFSFRPGGSAGSVRCLANVTNAATSPSFVADVPSGRRTNCANESSIDSLIACQNTVQNDSLLDSGNKETLAQTPVLSAAGRVSLLSSPSSLTPTSRHLER